MARDKVLPSPESKRGPNFPLGLMSRRRAHGFGWVSQSFFGKLGVALLFVQAAFIWGSPTPEQDPVPTKVSKDMSTVTMQTEIGKIEVSVETKNTDFASQCQAQWEKAKKKEDPKKGGNKGNGKKQESHAPGARVSITWSDSE